MFRVHMLSLPLSKPLGVHSIITPAVIGGVRHATSLRKSRYRKVRVVLLTQYHSVKAK